VATRDSRREAGSHRASTPITAAAVLLGVCLLNVYIAKHLPVAGVAHALAAPNAAVAVAPDRSPASAPSVTASSFTAGAGESSTSESLGQVAERTDNSRECRPSAAIDSQCIFN